ncbi:MAG TPA: hypothetical protein VK174_02160 [Chitinophagales bacterium]|nr:hypothetical protein [Chitinophagales bacterium]
MREIVFTTSAYDALLDICEFVEQKNTEGSGKRFFSKFEAFMQKYLPLTNLKFPLCKSEELAIHYYSCIVFQKKWIVAFRYNEEQITIHRIILGSKIN